MRRNRQVNVYMQTFYLHFYLQNLGDFHPVQLPVAWEQFLEPSKPPHTLLLLPSPPPSSFPTSSSLTLALVHGFLCLSLGKRSPLVWPGPRRGALPIHSQLPWCFLNPAIPSRDTLSAAVFHFLFVSPQQPLLIEPSESRQRI